jgi:hypothetical protein
MTSDRAFSRSVLGKIELDIPWWRPFLHRWVVITTTLLAVAAYGVSLWLTGPSDSTSPAKNASPIFTGLAALAAGATFIVSYFQWQLARHEISFDKFYEKLNITNQTINACGLKEARDHAGEIDHLRNMRVFAQLDTLEYVLGKYRLGFVEFDLVDRAIRTFRSDCDIPWFAEKVLHWIGRTEGEQVAKGYHGETRKAARYIVRQCHGASWPD